MTDLPESLFANPVWHALQTVHRHMAICSGDVGRYPAQVAPFAAVREPTATAMYELCALLEPSEAVWVIGRDLPRVPELLLEEELPCLQMVLPENAPAPSPSTEIDTLSCSDAGKMVALTDIAFPGFFRIQTCLMGSWIGVHWNGELIAMGGERLKLEGNALDRYSEISALCTHPAHRGKGLATNILWELVNRHRREGVVPWLHVKSLNRHAIDLYQRLGFRIVREVVANRVRRTG